MGGAAITAAEVSAAANAAATAATTAVNTALSTQLNNGYKRRMELYNYECADNDIRKVRVFVPLRLIFGSCNVDRLLKVINLEIKIDRKPTADIGEIFYGGANTSVQFDGNDGTGVQNMTLQLMEYIPNPYLVNELNSYIGHGGKIHWTFRTRDCEKRATEQSAEVTLSTKRTTHPDYVYVVCKDVRQKNNRTRKL